MIYLLLAITIPILGAKGLDTFLEVYENDKSMKKVYTVIGGLLIMSLLLFMFGEFVLTFSGFGDARYDPMTISKLKSARIELFNKGNFFRDFTYISDITNSISKLILKPPKKIIPYNVFNIGRSKPEKVKNFVNEILKQLNNKKIKKKS